MRSLERNKITIYYALYNDKIPIKDEFGNETGQYTNGYEKPLKFKIRVSANKGESEDNAFGKSLDYDRVMNTTDHKFPADEYSILWIDRKPQLDSNGEYPVDSGGNLITNHDYTVKKVAKDLNEWMYAIKKVTNNAFIPKRNTTSH